MTFRYSERPSAQPEFRIARPRHLPNDEGFTGIVQGKKASDIEERVARSLRKIKKKFTFQVRFRTMHSLPGEEKQVDFLVGKQPVEVYGYIGHFFSSGQRAKDIIRENLLNEVFRFLALKPLKILQYNKLDTQEESDAFVRRELA